MARQLNQINAEITADQAKLNAAQITLDKLTAAAKPNTVAIAKATADVKLWTDAITRLNDEKTALATSEANNFTPLPTPPLTPSAADVSTLAAEVTAAKADPNKKSLTTVGIVGALAVGVALYFAFTKK
jgi:hypothetical protein